MSWIIPCSECGEKVKIWVTIGTSEGMRYVCLKCFNKELKKYDKDND